MANISFTYALVADTGDDVVEIYLSTDRSDNFVLQNIYPVPSLTSDVFIYADPFIPYKVFGSFHPEIQIRYSTDGFNTNILSGGDHTTVSSSFYSFSSASPTVIFALNDDWIVRSLDGGLTFNKLITISTINPTASGGDYAVYFPNDQIGYVTLEDKLYITYDLGANWTEVLGIPVIFGEVLTSIAASNSGETIIVVGVYGFYTSTDYGATWSVTVFPTATQSYVQKYSDTVFYVYQNTVTNRTIYVTTDSGFTFNTVTPTGITVSIGKTYINYYTLDEVILHGEAGPINKSIDGGSTFTTTFLSKIDAVSVAQFDCGECPEDFVLIDGFCTKEIVVPPNVIDPGSTINVFGIPSPAPANYGNKGLNLMPLVGLSTIPITGFNPIGCTDINGSCYKFENSIGATIFPQPGYGPIASNQYDGPSVIMSPLWTQRLANVGVSNGDVGEESLCFTFCTKVPTTKIYLIGIAGDNTCQIFINNILYIDLNTVNSTPTVPFNYWHVFPVTLPTGDYEIKLCGQSPEGQFGFGAEIYNFPDPDPVQFFKDNFTSFSAQASDLEPYILFSTKDQIGTTVPNPDDPPVYQCPNSEETFSNICTNLGAVCTFNISYPYFPCTYKLTNCQDSLDILYTTNDLSSDVGLVVNLVGSEYVGKCYLIEKYNFIATELVNVIIAKRNQTCITCLPSYKLYDCLDPENILYTTQTEFAVYVNPSKTVRLIEYPNVCWQVGINSDEQFTPSILTVDGNFYTSCETCLPQYFILTNCSDGNQIFVEFNKDLEQNLNSIVQVSYGGFDPQCFSVELVTGFPNIPLITVNFVAGGFADCECCTYIPPVPEPTPWIRSVQEPANNFTIVRISDCDIQLNKKFADSYYKLFKGLKYGIESCCKGIDYDKLWIQKELSDYSFLKDPNLC